MVLPKAGILPPLYQRVSDAALLLATAYRAVYSVSGGYIVARLAPDRPRADALVLGVIGVVATTLGAVATWNRGPEFGPHWYPLALTVLAMPAAWAGGRLYGMQLDTRAHA